jgi:hypothetical protein
MKRNEKMPARRKKQLLRKLPVLEPWQMDMFLYGKKNSGLAFFKTMALSRMRKDLWSQYRVELMKKWAKQNPCTRPYDWFTFEAKQPRRMIDGKGVLADRYYQQTYRFGIPVFWFEIDDDKSPQFESQAKYLQRLKLLSAEEKTFLKAHPELLEPEDIFDIFNIIGENPQIVMNPDL